MRARENRRRLPGLRATLVGVVLVGVLLLAAPAGAAPSAHPFEIVPGSFHVSTATGQAAAHADLTVSFDIAHEGANGPNYNDLRTVVTNLPPGFIGNNTAVPTCTLAELIGNRRLGQPGNPRCSPATQVGVISFNAYTSVHGREEVSIPLYNMEVTSFGVTAELGFNYAGNIIGVLPVTVRPDDSGITVTSPNIERVAEARSISVTTWALPAAHEHDAQRGLECYSRLSPVCATNDGGTVENPHPLSAGIPVKPFLSNPTSCEAHVAQIEADSWEHPDEWSRAETEAAPASSECERVPFDPSIEIDPTTRAAESPSGLNISLLVPQRWESPYSLSTSHLKDSTVALPVGYTANPSLASGLGTCTPQQFESETSSSPPGAGCPPESKIGTVEVETPVLAEKLTGNIYIATPFDNRFGSLLALYIVVKDPPRGIVVMLAGRIEPNPVTGQLVTTFDDNPQVPFSKFTLKLRQGATSPLVSPPACGSYTAQADLTPWSAPTSPQHVLSPPFAIETGIGGGPCPWGGTPPFAPKLTAGTLNNAAGSYSPFYLHIEREDGEQELTRFSTIMPPGVTGNLSGIPFCPESDVRLAREKSGAQEEAEPSCPAASEIGHTAVGAGVGNVLAWTPGKVYLAGPYRGAPLSIVSVTSAKVGPFDLGTVVIRFALRINPITTQVEIDATGSDPIPHIIKGIVVHVRQIHVYIDRPNFIINPTSCLRMSISNTIDGAGADFTNPADQVPVTVTGPFQATNCATLAFKPSFKAQVTGKNSKVSGAGLTVKIAYPNAPQGTQANIHAVKVELPKQLPSRLTTLQKACLASVFEANPASCPAASVVGRATAVTPILPVPLTGPAYFVSNGNARFPELIMVLQGYGITVELHGETFIDKHGITSSTFHQVPDQPVSSFELTLPQAANSALAANTNLCSLTRTTITHKTVKRKVHGQIRRVRVTVRHTTRAGLKMPTEITAQNGMVIHQSTPIAVTGCPKSTAKKRAKHRKAAHHRKAARHKKK
jgi:hypothetical protein